MRDVLIDVTYEISQLELMTERDPSGFLLEKMRGRADRLASEQGGYVRTDRAPEIVVKQAMDRLTSHPMVLVASRWAAVVPEAARVG